MQQEITVSQRMVIGVRRLQAAVRRRGGVGVLAGLLLLPLGVGARTARGGRLSYTACTDDDFGLARYHAITCNGVVATRVGTAAHDILMGTNGPDVIVGFDGNDTIYGLGGNDLLCGNGGHDTLYGGAGDDILIGDTGTEVCDGGTQVQGGLASSREHVTSVP